MYLTPNTEANTVMLSLVEVTHKHMRNHLLAVYAYGSVIDSDFDNNLSDLDILTVIDEDVNKELLPILESIHKEFKSNNPTWKDRLDIAYISADSLQKIKEDDYLAAIKWYGAPFSIVESQPHWLIDWYKVQNQGIVLFGGKPQTVLPKITKEEFQEAIKKYILGWPANMSLKTEQTDLAFVVLTMCRSLFAYINGTNVSKPKGAEWMMQKYPQFKNLIRKSIDLSRATEGKLDINMQKRATELVDFVCQEIE